MLYACSENRLVSLPGFGTRTQEKIKEAIEYKMANQGILLYADAEFIVSEFIGEFEKIANYTPVVVSELRRKMEIIPSMELLADDSSDNLIEILKKIETVDGIDFKEDEDCIEFRFREQYEITIHLAQNEGFEERLMLLTGLPNTWKNWGWHRPVTA
ncbi:MAG: hypothetical protein R2850_12580 [Bacteroidia bacterium]